MTSKTEAPEAPAGPSDQVEIQKLESDARTLDKISLGTSALTLVSLGTVLTLSAIGCPPLLPMVLCGVSMVGGTAGWMAGNHAEDARAEAESLRSSSTLAPNGQGTAPTTLTLL